MPELGEEGQARLLGAGVFVVGAGGLGSAALLYLAAAGVGRLGIADHDRVERSNLNRQILHAEGDIGRPKIDSAREMLAALNPAVRVEAHPERLSAANIRGKIRGCDLVLDCSDNFPTRFLVNDACFFERKPLVSGAVHAFEGQLFTVIPGDESSGCYRCLVAAPPPPGDGHILGATAGVVGSLQAVEAVKLITGCGEPLAGQLLLYDGLRMRLRTLRRRRDPACRLCGAGPEITEMKDEV